jgi:hypothetical protein
MKFAMLRSEASDGRLVVGFSLFGAIEQRVVAP